LNACEACNNLKSTLEDDISAISLQPDGYGKFPHNDPNLSYYAKIKGKGSQSRHTGKPVSESRENIQIKGELVSGVTIAFSLSSPPQISDDRAFALAHFHLAAFFYFITFNADTKLGGFWPGAFLPLMQTRQQDWGNKRQLKFMELISSWPMRFIGETAESFFKIVIRRHPTSECWAWALEWNRNIRVIGFFGDRSKAQEIVDTLPVLEFHYIHPSEADPHSYRSRQEVPLSPSDDILFQYGGPPLP
jgi:hypothetical protein